MGADRLGAPAIGGSAGNAVTQLARALGAKHAISSTTITDGHGADVVIDSIGGEILSEALSTLAMGGTLTTLGYSAGRKTNIDVTDLIWKRAMIKASRCSLRHRRTGKKPPRP